MGLLRWYRGLSTLADEALAERIIRSERIKRATARVELYEEKDQHLCLDPTCLNPVVGRAIFGHCERHLEPWERNWLQDDVEKKGIQQPRDPSDHPLTTQIRKSIEDRTLELIEQIALDKKRALDDARSLMAREKIDRRERSAWLPRGLDERLEAQRSLRNFSVSRK